MLGESLRCHTMPRMEQLPTPHNNFFRFALSHLPNARGLIETQLPEQALSELNLDTLALRTGSFVDPDLREKFSDLLFSVELTNRADDGSSDEALVYFLFEHKSQSDSLTVLQLLSYIVRIWEQRVRDGLPLCPVIPLLVYHGESGWTAAKSLAELIGAPAGLSDYQVRFHPPLLDLSQAGDDEIQGEPVLRNTLRLLKYSRSKQLVEKLGEIIGFIGSALPEAQLVDWIQAIGVYVMTVNKNIDHEQYKQTLASILPTQFEPGSLADRLLTQGREEGFKKGELVGKCQLLEELLGRATTQHGELLALGIDALTSKIADLQQQLRDRDD